MHQIAASAQLTEISLDSIAAHSQHGVNIVQAWADQNTQIRGPIIATWIAAGTSRLFSDSSAEDNQNSFNPDLVPGRDLPGGGLTYREYKSNTTQNR